MVRAIGSLKTAGKDFHLACEPSDKEVNSSSSVDSGCTNLSAVRRQLPFSNKQVSVEKSMITNGLEDTFSLSSWLQRV
jgi:hypothetical protein